ncbi:hypothetical protein MAR_007638 [Mya arenaria]|uniref:Uncharacterized protein n=1 Tax=Mya arenaria TaxID=6604 RepID=A0ABY7DBW3_MYAAR|nr:hypothetical protein MAR_007638 [Mya arenaria]
MIGRLLRDTLMKHVGISPWFTIMVIETTDVSVINEMIVYIRTEFLSVLPFVDYRRQTPSELPSLTSVNLLLDRKCVFSSDGAAALRVPHLVNNYCLAHRLALVAVQAVKVIPYLPQVKDILGDKSPIRTKSFNVLKELKLLEVKDVR